MGADAVFTIVVLLVTVGLIAREVFSPDFLLLGALLVFATAGVLSPRDVLAGFSNPDIATIAGLFLVAAGIRATGLIDRVTQAMFGKGASLRSGLARTTTLSAVGSAFMSNTAIVAIGIPTLGQWARDHGISPSKLLIPLSYASIIGGISTLIGTSTNLVMDGLLRQHGLPGIGFLELAVVGVPVLGAGIAYLTLLAPRLLPARVSAESPEDDVHEFVTDVQVNDASDLVGQTVRDAGLDEVEEPTWEMYRAVIPRGSPLVETRLKEAEFRARYNASVVAVQRRGENVEKRVGEARLRAGDTLVLEASPEFDQAHREYNELLVMSPLRGPRRREARKQ